jgi:PIN domain nuclease of toxin-antitoxin system
MNPPPVLDTHVWIWWMLGDLGLSIAEREALDALPPETRTVLSDISLWEFATLVDMGRVEIEGSIEDWLRVAASPATVRIQPITPGIVAEMNRLPAAFHRDPADRLIVATARVLSFHWRLRNGKSAAPKMVPIWKP